MSAPLHSLAAAVLPALLLASAASAAPAAAPCTVIAGATAHLPDGAVDGVTAVLADGTIQGLGPSIAGLGAPRDGTVTWNGRACRFVDGAGRQITPGLIEPHSTVGLVEVSLEESTRHNNAGGEAPVRAHVLVIDGYDPLSSVVPVTRREGITAAVLQPDGGSFSGTAGAVLLTGRTQGEAVVRDPSGKAVGRTVAVRANLAEGASFAARLSHLRDVLDDARAYSRDPAAWRTRQASRPEPFPEQSIAALAGVIDRKVPLVLSADSAAQLEVLSVFALQQGIRLVVEGAAEGWIVADLLAGAGIAVAIDPFVYGPGGFDQMHGRPDNGALLAAAGVPVMITTGSAHFARKLRQLAGNAVRGGMTHEAALAAITSVPADVYGLGGRGRLRLGAPADVVVWTGDPLEVDTWPEHVFIGGVEQSLLSRQTELRDRYMELPGSPTAPLPLP
jgi:imidazolonepropionase-like amidohydrolase